MGSGEKWRSVVGNGGVWWRVVRSGEKWRGVVESGGKWWEVVRSGGVR